MKIFLDSNVLIAAIVEKHESHARAFRILDRVQNGRDEGVISAHSLAEVYSVITKAPPPIRHTSEQALLSIEGNIVRFFETISLTGHDYAAVIRDAALAGIQGGTIYDAVLLNCAAKAGVEKILTLNLRHFENIAPGKLRAKITVP